MPPASASMLSNAFEEKEATYNVRYVHRFSQKVSWPWTRLSPSSSLRNRQCHMPTFRERLLANGGIAKPLELRLQRYQSRIVQIPNVPFDLARTPDRARPGASLIQRAEGSKGHHGPRRPSCPETSHWHDPSTAVLPSAESLPRRQPDFRGN